MSVSASQTSAVNGQRTMASATDLSAILCGPRRHTKTFTGCWTCRSRKVKCDEARPSCLQCRTKSLHCEGYRVRLQWMPIDHTGSATSTSSQSLPRAKLQRSQVAYEPRGQSLEPSELDGILYSIDAYELGSDTSTRIVDDALFIHNFGVFDPEVRTSGALIPSHDDKVTPSTTYPDTDPAHTHFRDDRLEFNQVDSSITRYCITGRSESAHAPLQLSDVDGISPDDRESGSVIQQHSPLWFEETGLHLDEPQNQNAEEARGNVFRSIDTTGVLSPHYQWRAPSGRIIHNPSPSSLPEQEQFLMYHYSHRVVNLFCVIDNKKSPWKTIHLPRALQSIGQLTVTGSSSAIRDALRNALLSISAFYLSNDSKKHLCMDEATKWARKATMLRGKAIELLKDAIENDINDESAPKYKEFLATMLSMITINVMSGETSSCGVHLDGALHFMNQAKAWKARFSQKARALHRIYFYLRAIYESTALEDVNSFHPEPSTFEVPRSLQSASSAYAIDPQPDMCPSPTDSNISEPGIVMNTYECIYGVPQNLLVLLSRTSKLIREFTPLSKRKDRSPVSTDFSRRCDDLEKTIMDWPIALELERCCIAGMGPSSDIIRQTTYAFHNALIIYFAQHIRLLGYRYLQSYVQNVIESIEAIEKIKVESRILAAPIYWPAFIAATEAFNHDLQARFKAWYDQVEVYGIEAVRTGISVLAEVWERGPVTGKEMRTSRWRSVVEETGCHLMLS